MGTIIKVPYCGSGASYQAVIALGVRSKTQANTGESMYVGRINQPLVKYAMIYNGTTYYELFACLLPTGGSIAYSANMSGWGDHIYTETINSNRTMSGVTIYYDYSGISNLAYSYPEPFDSLESALAAMNNGDWSESGGAYLITYSATNGTVSGPSEAAVDTTVTASCTFPEGYHMANPESDIAVTSGGESVPFTWDAANSQITFTMPEGAVTVSVTGSLIPTYPITYRPTRVTLDGPATAAVGATVNVDCTFPAGYGRKTADSITVTCNGTPVAFSWDSENQRITFTMPDPTGGGE